MTMGGTQFTWGRWDAGAATTTMLTDRITDTATSRTMASGTHWVTGSLANGPTTLPTTGIVNYAVAGTSTPTDQYGNSATLNAATLSANFTTQTVNVGVNVTAGGATLDAAARNLPIQQRALFTADSRQNGVNGLVVTCQGATCGTSHQGTILGSFFGSEATAAAFSYKLTKEGASMGNVSGIAVFKRP